MKRVVMVALSILCCGCITACNSKGADIVPNVRPTENETETASEHEMELTEAEEATNMKTDKELSITQSQESRMYIQVGDDRLEVLLEENAAAQGLLELLAEGPVTISASNYGGFEKVCSLGENLPQEDVQITTKAGDVCLYTGNRIVIFYGSNSWEYTRIGRVDGKSASELKDILGGSETEVTLSLK